MESERVNGMEFKSFEEMLDESRERYTTGISDILDAELARFPLSMNRVQLLQDAALFVCSLIALKTAEVQTPESALMDAKDPLRAWWPIEKRIKAEVGPWLLEYGREASARQMKGTGDEVE